VTSYCLLAVVVVVVVLLQLLVVLLQLLVVLLQLLGQALTRKSGALLSFRLPLSSMKGFWHGYVCESGI
jgi:hypothetical protein